MTRELREVAQAMVDEYGCSALDDRLRIMDWLADRELLSPLDDPDHHADRRAADAVKAHARWLLS